MFPIEIYNIKRYLHTSKVYTDYRFCQQSLAKHTRGRTGEEGGPPPWIPFGQKILKQNMQAKNFKVSKTVVKDCV